MCRLPSKSPWLNPIEPKWVHGKRVVSEPVRTLSVAELMHRICAYYNCILEDLMVQEGYEKCLGKSIALPLSSQQRQQCCCPTDDRASYSPKVKAVW